MAVEGAADDDDEPFDVLVEACPLPFMADR
jgi:hypothetical protein